MLRDAVNVLMFSPLNVTGPLSVMSPVPAPVPAVTASEYAPPFTVANVKPGVLMNVLLPVSVIGPVTDAAVAAVLDIEPPEEMPVPATDSAFAKVKPYKSMVAPLTTVASAVPNAPLVKAPTVPTDAMPTFSVPAEMVDPPEYVLPPDSDSVPVPDLVKPPVPAMTPP